MSRIVVVGAGVSGMTAAFLLVEAGHEVMVLEREDAVGGLARTFAYGDFKFDIGPHRFHTDDPVVLDFLRGILKDNWSEIDRKSGVWMYGRYHDWPLRPSSVLKLPLPVMARAGLDLFRKSRQQSDNFKDYILGMYGKTLYELFFGPYTKKFIREEPELIHSDWAVSGIDRAVIDKRVQMNTLSQVIKGALLPRAVRTEFVYPARGGIAQLCLNLKNRAEVLGGKILTGARVVSLSRSNDRIGSVRTEAGETIPLDILVWTAPISELVRMTGASGTWLSYISTICYNYAVDGEPGIPYQWCYYGQEDVIYNRLAIPVLFSSESAPAGKSGICAEVTCIEGDRVWDKPEMCAREVEKQLLRTRVIKKSDQIESMNIERIPNTYPVYKLGYREELARVKQNLASFENLKILGRTGTFWYNNMDHSIRTAIDTASALKGGVDSGK
jgi:protoporphyrinogen oxidase